MKLKKLLVAAVATVAIGGAGASVADAAVGGSVSIPRVSNAVGRGYLDYWRSGNANGRVHIDVQGSGCYYAQYKLTTGQFLDFSSWKRIGSGCRTTDGTVNWSDSFPLNASDGVKFRLCRNVSYWADDCGSASAIISSWR